MSIKFSWKKIEATAFKGLDKSINELRTIAQCECWFWGFMEKRSELNKHFISSVRSTEFFHYLFFLFGWIWIYWNVYLCMVAVNEIRYLLKWHFNLVIIVTITSSGCCTHLGMCTNKLLWTEAKNEYYILNRVEPELVNLVHQIW